MRSLTAIAAAALALSLTGQAAATTYTFGFDEPNRGGSQAAGSYQALQIRFDDGLSGADDVTVDPRLNVSGQVLLDTTFGEIGGGWFVLSPGGDPRDTTDQLAILYMDFDSGRISAYRYDGRLGSNGIASFRDDDLFIGSFDNAVQTSVVDGLLSFDISDLDVSSIQTATDAADYTGVGFGEEIGIWLHLSILRDIAFAEDGRLEAFRTGALASFDLPTGNALATPIPGAALFVVTGLAGMVAGRRLRQR